MAQSILSSGILLPRILRLGATGAAVTLLHSGLLRLHIGQITSSEVSSSTFGTDTKKTIEEFQRRNFSDNPAKTTGLVDADTAAALLSLLRQEEPSSDYPAVYFLAGHVVFKDGRDASGLNVDIYDRGLRPDSEVKVNKTAIITDKFGTFLFEVSRKDLQRAEGTSPSFAIRVLREKEVLYQAAIDQVIYNAPMLALTTVQLAVESPNVSPVDQFTRCLNAVRPHLPAQTKLVNGPTQGKDATASKVTPSLVAAGSLDARVVNLRENKDAQDISVLSHLTKSAFTSKQLIDLVLSQRLASFAQDNQASLSPEFFYAFTAGSSAPSLSNTFFTDLGLTGFDVSAPVEPLFYKIILLEQSKLTAALTSATNSRLIPSSTSADIPKAIEVVGKFRQKALDYFNSQPALEDQWWQQLDAFLKTGKEEAVEAVFKQDNALGDIQGLLKQLLAAVKTDKSQKKIAPVASAVNATPAPIVKRINAVDLATATNKSQKELALLTPSELSSVVQSSSAVPKDAKSQSLDIISAELETRFPSTSFTARLNGHISAGTKEVLGKSSGVDAKGVLDFLQRKPDFDLLSHNVDKALGLTPSKTTNAVAKPSEDDSKIRESLKTVQKTFKLAPSFDKVNALLNIGASSAHAIESMGKDRLQILLQKDSSFTAGEIDKVYRKAKNVNTATRLVLADFQSSKTALTFAGTSSAPPPAKIEAVTKDFPNLKSLFQRGDICACTDCNSVYGPSAYLVDVLEFLKRRILLDSVDGPNSGLSARSALLGRRPDIGNLDLSCDNTNITLPYIDLVNELLEALVAPKAGDTFQGTLAAGIISQTLLNFLNQLKLPFTSTATVSGPSPDGSFTARDKSVVVTLNRSGGGPPFTTWTVQVLRQSYTDSATLGAQPYYNNKDAYVRLSNASFLPLLPFNSLNEEGRQYFTQFSLDRATLMRNLSTSSGAPNPDSLYKISLVDLGLSAREGDLITTTTTVASDQEQFWNTGNAAAPQTYLKNVQNFIDTARITYVQLQALIRCTGWLNPPSGGVNELFVRHLDDSCTLAKKEIVHLDLPALDRLHRLMRLKDVLERSRVFVDDGVGDGVEYALLDRAIALPTLGGGKLDAAFLVRLAQLRQVVHKLSVVSKWPVDVYGVLSLLGSLSLDDSAPLSYASVFLSAAKTGPIDEVFLVMNVTANSTRAPGTAELLTAHQDYLARCLGISVADVQRIVDTFQDKTISFGSVSQAYAISSLARHLELSIADLLLLKDLTAVNPFSSPDGLLSFVGSAGKIEKWGLSATDVSYFLKHSASDITARDLSDTVITTILTQVQAAFAAAKTFIADPLDAQPDLDLRKTVVAALIQKIPSLSTADVGAFTDLMNGKTQSTSNTFLTDKLGSFGLPLTTLQQALGTLQGNPTSSDSQSGFVVALYDIAFGISYKLQRTAILLQLISDAIHVPIDVVTVIINNVDTVRVLQDAALAEGTISRSAFGAQYNALQLINILVSLSTKLSISPDALAWLLQRSDSLGWLNLKAIPVSNTAAPLTFTALVSLLDGLELASSPAFSPVKNPADASKPFTVLGFFELVLSSGVARDAIVRYMAGLMGIDLTLLDNVLQRLGVGIADFKKASILFRVNDAVQLLRKINLPLQSASQIADAVDLTATGVASIRQALRERYSDQEWLGVLKSIQDGIRVKKRDALIYHVLATNKPDAVTKKGGLGSAQDISDYLLVDVEMGSETLTSRIIQAHASVQLYVQRLRMGLEPTPIVPSADEAAAWKQWDWMAQYRLWEANRKVFLYPENWIEPELRDDKSQIFDEFEQTIKQNELSSDNIEKATHAYLENLDRIADLEPMATYYQTELSTQHVFARTKGGDPVVTYYRQLQKEQFWTPWEKLEGVDVTGDHLLTFVRNSRLTIVWPHFVLEADPAQQKQAPPIPDPDELKQQGGTPSPPLNQRLAIYLTTSERDPKTGKWSAKKVSREALYWPDSGGAYMPANEVPTWAVDYISLRYWSFGGGVGDLITVTQGHPSDAEQYEQETFTGAFSLVGCKGYPEPYRGSQYDSFNTLLPRFKDADYYTQRYRKTPYLGTSSASWIGPRTAFDYNYRQYFQNSYGKFSITYPSQIALIDLALILIEIYAIGNRTEGPKGDPDRDLRYLNIPTGTLMPYFYTDDSARSYAIIPGFYGKEGTDPKTVSDVYDFINRAMTLARKYLKMYFDDPNHDINKVRQVVEKDPEYIALLNEFYAFYWKVEQKQGNEFNVQMVNFYHPLVCHLRKALYTNGFDSFFARSTQLAQTSFDFATKYTPTASVKPSFPKENLEFQPQDAYASYNWELFFHLPFEMATYLSQDQKFEEARNWYHYIFNPQGDNAEDPDTGPGKAMAPQKKYWITKPFFKTQAADYLEQRIDGLLYNTASDPAGVALKDAIKLSIQQWRSKPFSPHGIARTRTVAYQTTVVMKYIKNLLDWGDELFRRLTRETITQATQLYMLAERLLGPKPQIVEPAIKTPTNTYNELAPKLDLFGNALLDLENVIPDLSTLPHHGEELPSPPSLHLLYFGIPANQTILDNYDLVADRLHKIRSSQNIDGETIALALTAPPIDPGALVKAAAAAGAGGSASTFLAGLNAPSPIYRFWYISETALQLTAQVTSLGMTLLSLIQQRDAEGLARLRSGLELNVLQAVRKTKVLAQQEAEDSLLTIARGRDVVLERQNYYKSKRDLMNQWEKTAMVLSGLSVVLEVGVALGTILAGITKMAPTVTAGAQGFGGSPALTVSIGGNHIGGAMETLVGVLSSAGRGLDKTSNILSQQGAYHQRMDEWQFQARLATKELSQLDAVAKAAETRKQGTISDLAAHDSNITSATQIDTFMRNKYTNVELYDWSIGQISKIYFGAYKLAYGMAKQAERCLAYELAMNDATTASFIQPNYWDSLKSGLLAGEQLTYDLKRMETSYMEKNTREYELTKNISLDQLDPFALITLRATGKCTFSIPESVFDLDNPGHYLRRNKSVSISIPAVVGPLVSISAKLTLVSNRYRCKPTLRTSGDAYEEDAAGDSRFIYNVGSSVQSICTSTGVSDSGVFDFTSAATGRDNGDRYLPFERTGAVGVYNLELPTKFRQFDYDSITDVVLHVAYTAREGGRTLRDAVEAKQLERLNNLALDAQRKGLFSAHSLRREYSAQWFALLQKSGATTSTTTTDTSVEITLSPLHIPFFATADARTVSISNITWLAKVKGGKTGTLGLLIDKSVSVSLAKVDALKGLWKGEVANASNPAGGIVLGKKFTVEVAATSDVKVEDLLDVVLLVKYQIAAAAT